VPGLVGQDSTGTQVGMEGGYDLRGLESRGCVRAGGHETAARAAEIAPNFLHEMNLTVLRRQETAVVLNVANKQTNKYH